MNVVTVSQLNTYVRAVLDESNILSNIYVSGEISNFTHYQRSGHMYFTLKDDKAQIKCVMFASSAYKLRFIPENGMSVICRGRVTIYEKDGAYQLYVDDMDPQGIGALTVAYEKLKKELESQGYFSDEHKKPLPKYPKVIGVATSSTGAAVEDIKNITNRRFPLCNLIISPTVVQGDKAVQSIVNSIKKLESINEVDLIIVGRGGGSIEDLWAFNSREVANAVFQCEKPIISAVGHETDFTICDFVADLRAPTPSAAAELALPNADSEYIAIETLKNNIIVSLSRKIDNSTQELNNILSCPLLVNPNTIIESYRQNVDDKISFITDLINSDIDEKQLKFTSLIKQINALNPLAVLTRGFSVVKDEHNNVIKSKNEINNNEDYLLTFVDGEVKIKALKVEECQKN